MFPFPLSSPHGTTPNLAIERGEDVYGLVVIVGVGAAVSAAVGVTVGVGVGVAVGAAVGVAVGVGVGAAVGRWSVAWGPWTAKRVFTRASALVFTRAR